MESGGEAPRSERGAEASAAVNGNDRPGTSRPMEALLVRRNLQVGLERVRQNKGSPGIERYLREHWPPRPAHCTSKVAPSMIRLPV